MKIKKIVLQFFIFILFLGVALWLSPQKVFACTWTGCSNTYLGYYYSWTQTCTSTPACTMNSGTCTWPPYPGSYFCSSICGTFTLSDSACSSNCLAGTYTHAWYNQCGAYPEGVPPQTLACGPLCSPVTCAGYTYGSYGPCSSTCGEAGTKTRPRYYACNGGAAGTVSTTCYECDSWGCAGYTYGSWGACSCPAGTQTRTATDNCSGASACGVVSCSQSCACNAAPSAPSVSSPSNGATGVSRTPAISLASTDTNGDYIRYKIQIATDAGFTANVQTFDQTASQTSWSGQNADESRAYTSGATATYTVQTALSQNLLYYLRAYAIDPGGSVTWSTASTSISFTTISSPPSTPSLDLPANGATNQSLINLVLKTTTTDPNSDYLRYKIEMCADAAMTTGCQTFTQPTGSPQTGWTGQNTQTSTAYSSGTQGVYTFQSVLPFSTTYYWRSYAIDPGGSNDWSSTQGTPYSFTTTDPNIPSLDSPANAATNVLPNFTFKTTASDPDNDYLVYKIQVCTNAAMTTSCQLFDQTASAVGWTGQSTNTIDIIDSYTDSTKINTGSSTNQQVTGGQLKMYDLALCPTHGICQTGGSYANGNCVAVANATVGTDPNNDCTASYNNCSGNNRIGPDGNCNGSGACNTTGQSSACTTASTCQTGGGCSAGSCISVTNVAAGNDPNNQCSSYGCTTKVYGWDGNNCKAAVASSGDGMCNGSAACNTTFATSCTSGGSTLASCGSAGCKKTGVCVQESATTTSDTVAEICFTSGQNGCGAGTACNASGTCPPWNFTNTSTGTTGTIQTWTVPATGSYTIEAWGAQGGYGTSYADYHGKGAYMKGTFSLTANQVLKILVGQAGANASYGGGGGGGTFVTDNSNNPLIVAGGGGGAYGGAGDQRTNYSNATTATTGRPPSNAYQANCNSGGGGLTGNGQNSTSCSTTGGTAFINGGNGGNGYITYCGAGGFGGGAGCEWCSCGGAGAGGGYGGGGGGVGPAGGNAGYYDNGGGGSYNGGTSQTNTEGVRDGHGAVTITAL